MSEPEIERLIETTINALDRRYLNSGMLVLEYWEKLAAIDAEADRLYAEMRRMA